MSEDLNQTTSSFDRYLANRAPSLLWSTTAARASVINTRVGYGLVAFSTVMCTIGVAYEGVVGLAFGMGPMIGGVVNIAIGSAWRNRAKRNAGNTEVPTQVWTFLHGLATHVLGPSYPSRASNLGYYPVSNTWNGWRLTPKAAFAHSTSAIVPPGAKSAREILNPKVFEMMEEVAKHFNRVNGYLTNPSISPGSLPREAARIQVAADQAMIDALAIACSMHQFPENIESMRPSLEACTAALKEAADLVSSMQLPKALEPVPQEQAALLRGMLEDLRVESQARSELNEPDRLTNSS